MDIDLASFLMKIIQEYTEKFGALHFSIRKEKEDFVFFTSIPD
ncbi:hypothetical protein [Bacillus sp. FJAT-42376]|nr:hypothetical protein [Bacillus sp. FJAT-42376]